MIPFVWVLIRFVRSLWRSLKAPEFQALLFLVIMTLASGAFLPAGRGVELSWLSILRRHHAHNRGLRDFLPLHDGGQGLDHLLRLLRDRGYILGFVDTGAQRSMEHRGEVRRLLERRAKGADSDAEEG